MPARIRSEAHSPTTRSRSGPADAGAVEDVGRQLGRQLVHVLAAVAVLRDRRPQADRGHRCAQVPHLLAEVVEVVLPRHAVAGGLEDPAEQVADERAPRVPDVERPGGVGRDELHVHVLRTHRRDVAEPGAGPPGGVGRRLDERRCETDVEEPGRRDLHGPDRRPEHGCRGVGGIARRRRVRPHVDARDLGIALELDRERPRDLQGRPPVRPGQLHREVRRQVTVLGMRRAVHLDRRHVGSVHRPAGRPPRRRAPRHARPRGGRWIGRAAGRVRARRAPDRVGRPS